MKRLLFIFTFGLTIFASAQTTYIWTGATNKDWQVPTNWSPSRTTIASSDKIQFSSGLIDSVINVPTQTVQELLVATNTTVILEGASSSSRLIVSKSPVGLTLTVQSGAVLEISTGTNGLSFEIAGASGNNVDISGTLVIKSGGKFSSNTSAPAYTTINVAPFTGAVVVNGTGEFLSNKTNITFNSGSSYTHNRDGGALPTATWNSNSTCNITGIISTNPTWISGTYGHVTWNNVGQTTATGAVNVPFTIAGNLNVTSGTFAVGGITVTVQGDIDNNGTINTLATGSTLVMNGTTLQTIQSSAGTGIWTTGTLDEILNLTINNNSGLSPAVNFNINAAIRNQLYLQNGELGGSGTLTEGVANVPFSMIRHVGSLSSTFFPAFTPTKSTTFNAIYGNGLTPLPITTGNELPYAPLDSINNFTGSFSTVGGRVLLSKSVQLGSNGVLSLTNTLLELGSNDFTINNIGTGGGLNIVGSSTNMVVADGTGQLKKLINAGASDLITFPVGDNTLGGPADYSPFSIKFSANSTPRTLGIRVTDAVHPNVSSTDYITRYWSFTDNAGGTYVYSIASLTYSTNPPSDLIGSGSKFTFNRWNGINWVGLNSTLTLPTISTSESYDEIFGTLGGNDFTARYYTPMTYYWQPNSGTTENFQDPANWIPNRNSPYKTDILVFNNGGSSTANNIPTQILGRIQVNNSGGLGNTTVTFDASAPNTILTATNGMAIAAGSELTLGSANTFTLQNESGQTGSIAGVLNVNQNNTFIATVGPLALTVSGSINNQGGTITGTPATLIFANGSFYNHNRDGGTIPSATFFATGLHTKSTVNITGVVSTNPTWLSSAYSNLIWNCTAQTTATGDLSNPIAVRGNLEVLAGTFSDGGFQIGGNSAGTCTVASGATLSIGAGGATTTVFPTNFTNANILLANNSTVIYNSTSAVNITAVPNYYGNLTILGSAVRTLSGPIAINGNLSVKAGLLSDGGFQITGNATGTLSVDNGATLQVGGGTSTVTDFPTNFTTPNISLQTNSTVNYSTIGASTVQTVASSIAGVGPGSYGNLTIIGASGKKQLAANCIVRGNFTNGTSAGIFSLEGFNMSLEGTFNNNTGVFDGTNASSTLTLSGTLPQTFTTNSGTYTASSLIRNLVIDNSSLTGVTLGAQSSSLVFENVTINAARIFDLNGRTIRISGLYTNNGTLVGDASGSTISMNGGSAQNFNVGNYTNNSLANFTMANTSGGVTLTAPLNVGAVFTLSNGILYTTATNLLTLTSSQSGSVSGGSSSSYVSGPLARTLPASIPSPWIYPVGKTGYSPFEFLSTSNNSVAGTIFMVEQFDGSTGGTPGSGFVSINSNRYWRLNRISGTGVITDAIIRITDPSATFSGSNAVGLSSTLTGAYTSLGNSAFSPSTTLASAQYSIPTGLPTDIYLLAGTRGNISGTFNIPSGVYKSLTCAAVGEAGSPGLFQAINSGVLNGNIVVNIDGDLTNETGTIALNQWGETGGGPYTVTIQPEQTSTALRIISSAVAPSTGLIRFNGADRLTIDGRVGGNGQYLLFRNTNTSASNTGPTMLFNNSSVSGTIRNTIIENNASTASVGALMIGSSGTNTSLTFADNDIRSATAGTVGPYTNGFYSNSVNNASITISGNSFYSASVGTSAQFGINFTGGNANSISGNFIGGQAAKCGTIGTYWNNSNNGIFTGIYASVGTTSATEIIGNTMQNISLSGTAGAGFTGINVPAGLVNVGVSNAAVANGNTVGHSTLATGILNAGNGTTIGISLNTPASGSVISGNTIAGFTTTGATAFTGISLTAGTSTPTSVQNNSVRGIAMTGNVASSFTGINVGAGLYNIGTTLGNTIGHISNLNSISYGGTGTAVGINLASTQTSASNIGTSAFPTPIGNTIANMTATNTGTGVILNGISSAATTTAQTISGNSIYNLTSSAGPTTAQTTPPLTVNGIVLTNGVANTTLAQNTIYGLSASNTGATIRSHAAGIAITGATSPVIRQNRIYDIRNASTNTTDPSATGIYLFSPSTSIEVSNNMISLGNSQTTNTVFNGILLNANAAYTANIIYNSVNIEGTVSAGALNSFGFNRVTSTTTTTPVVKNNIFKNTRTGGTGKHYAIASSGGNAAVNWSLSNINYNNLFTSNAATLGLWNSGDRTFATWKSNSGTDATSLTSNPTFINSALGDLHLNPASNCSVNGAGTSVNVAVDYDNVSRDLSTPDIGADEITPSGISPIPAGIYSVGVGKTYGTITQALADLQCRGIDGLGDVIMELYDATYSGNEAFPLNFASVSGAGNSSRIIFRPAAGASPTVSSAATTTINFNGGDYYTIDGISRSGATKLTINNTSTSGSVIQFINDGTNNLLQNLTIRGENNSVSSGTVVFSTGVSTGNDHNVLTNCDIRDGASVPAVALYSNGSASFTNSSNTISNNNIYNFSTNGIYVTSVGNGDSWNISGNSFYYNAGGNPSTAMVAINFLSGSNSNNINGNFIGGRDALAGGNAWNKGTTTSFTGISLSVGTTSVSTISSNTIANFNQSVMTSFKGIEVNAGTTSIQGNTIQAIALSAATNFNGINITAGVGTTNIGTTTGNIIGHLSTPNSIVTGGNGTTVGINCASTGTVNIGTPGNSPIGNTIANISANGTGTGTFVRGIVTPNTVGTYTIAANTIQSLTTSSTVVYNNTVATTSVVGILAQATSSGQNITQNLINTLSGNATTVATGISGIHYTGPSSGSNLISRNNIHTLNALTTSTATALMGIEIGANNAAICDVVNNMVSIGHTVLGNYTIRGIYKNTNSNGNFYYNSVRIGGTVSSATQNTYAFFRNVNAPDVFRNNIFVNVRIGVAKNYAIGLNSNSTFTSNNNNLFASNLVNLGTIDSGTTPLDFAAWKSSTSQDASSVNVLPDFVSATDLHLTGSNCRLYNAGLSVVGYPSDFDNQTRGTGSPNPTIGADELTTAGSALAGGTYNVGSGEIYPTLTAAIAALSCGITGPIIFNLTDANYSTNESFPLTIPSVTGASSTNTITFRPNVGISVAIQNTRSHPVFALNGANWFIFDGIARTGATQMSFSNTSTAGNVFQFLGDASNNILQNLTIRGVNSKSTTGTIEFLAGATAGNDNNLITNCDIRDGSTVPATAIYSNGTPGAAANSSNTISNNNIYNFTTNGILITSTGNGDLWNISGNSFYYNATTTATSAQTSINFLSASNNNTLANNFIGGQTSSAGGSAWVNSGAVSFIGIAVNGGSGIGVNATAVQNNTIQNINLSSTGSSSFQGINVVNTVPSGNVNIGTISGNTIGHGSVANSILVNGSGTSIGIVSESTGTVAISNNLIANLTSDNNSTSATLRGIVTSSTSGINIISSNTIRDLQNTANNTNAVSSSSVIGILAESKIPGQVLSGNTLTNLASNPKTLTTAVTVIGVHYAGPISGTNEINRNLMHTFTTSSTSSSSNIYGITLSSGVSNVVNNMIALGNTLTTSPVIRGIHLMSSGANNIYYNSVNITGSPVSGSGRSSAFFRGATSGTHVVRNNIFANSRSNNGSTSVHNAFTFAGSPSGMDATYNGYSASGTGGVLGITPDVNSIQASPFFNSATDLHLSGTMNCIFDGRGCATGFTSYTSDIDNVDLRATGCFNATTGPDIGADEFTASYPSITGSTAASRCGTGSVTLGATATATDLNWYDASTGGASLGTGTSFTTPSINSTKTYYVDVTVGLCTSNRTAVVATINPDPTADVGAPQIFICQGGVSAPMGGAIGGGAVGGIWTGGLGTWTNPTDVSNAVYSADPTEIGSVTLTLTTTGGICGTTAATKILTISSPPLSGTLSGIQDVCISGTTTFNSTVSGGTWSSSDPAVASVNALTGEITGVSAGTANITYTVAGTGGCPNASDTRTVTVTAPVTAGTLSGNQAICITGTTIYSSTVTGGTWSSSDASVANVDAATGAINGLSSGSAVITYMVTGSGGCPNATATLPITVSSSLSPGTLSGIQAVCTSGTSIFSSTVPGGAWSSSAINIATINPVTGDVTGVSVGTAAMEYTITGTGGCANVTATLTVTVSAPPSAGTLSGIQAVCVSGTTTFSSSEIGGTWSSADDLIATVDPLSGVISAVSAGTVNMNYTVTGTGGCANVTATLPLTVTAPPTAGTLSGTQGICITGTTTFSSSEAGGTWSSMEPTVATIDASTGDIVGLTAGTARMTYTVSGTGGCANVTDTLILTVTAPPTAGTLSGTQAICTSATTAFSSSEPGGVWSSSDVSVASIESTSGVVSGIVPGTATMTYTVTGTGGCSTATASAIYDVTVTAPPLVGALSGVQAICVSGNSKFSSTESGGTWSSSDSGIATTDPLTGDIVGLTAGVATMTYTVTGTGGCSNVTATIDLTVTAPPSAGTLSGPQVICLSGSTTLASTEAGGTWASLNPIVAQIDPVKGEISGTSLGSTTVTYTMSGTGGCSNTTATMTISVSNVLTAGTLSGESSVCANGQTTFSSSISNGAWSSSDILIASVDPSTGVVSGVSPGTVIMTYTIPGTAGCSSVAATKSIKVNPIETPGFDAVGPICSGTPLVLSNTSKNGIFGTWSPSLDNLTTTTYTFTPVSGQCANTNTLTVVVQEVTASLKEEDTIDDSLKLIASGGVSYSWSTGEKTESIKVLQSGKYNVVITDTNGCSEVKDIYVFINKVECTDVFVPNMFSPNGDNFNDKLVVEGSCIVDFNLRIFNRWGELVFQSKNKSDSWDGKFKGKHLNAGVFSYVFEYTDKENQSYRKIGNVTMMK